MVGKKNKLKGSKAICCNDILTKLIKDFSNLFAIFVYNNYNKSF